MGLEIFGCIVGIIGIVFAIFACIYVNKLNRNLDKQIKERTTRVSNTESMSCIKCDKELKKLYPDDVCSSLDRAMWDGGIVDKFVAGYGSDHDMDAFFFGICDDCVTKLKEDSKIIFEKNYF